MERKYYDKIFIIQTPLHFIVSNNYSQLCKGSNLFLIINNFDFMNFKDEVIGINGDYFLLPKEQHVHKIINAYNILFLYKRIIHFECHELLIFNDSSFRVQALCKHIKKDVTNLIEEGIAPYVSSSYRHDRFHRFFSFFSKYYESCGIGESDLYKNYYVTDPKNIHNRLEGKQIEKIQKDLFFTDCKSNVAIDGDEVLILSSPIYKNYNISFDLYLSILKKIIKIYETNRIFFKIHPMENVDDYLELTQSKDFRIEMINKDLSTSMIKFNDFATLVCFGFSSAFLYTDCNKVSFQLDQLGCSSDDFLFSNLQVEKRFIKM